MQNIDSTHIRIASYLEQSIVSTRINITPACSQHFKKFQACDYHCCTHAAGMPNLAIRFTPNDAVSICLVTESVN